MTKEEELEFIDRIITAEKNRGHETSKDYLYLRKILGDPRNNPEEPDEVRMEFLENALFEGIGAGQSKSDFLDELFCWLHWSIDFGYLPKDMFLYTRLQSRIKTAKSLLDILRRYPSETFFR
jgi:hypothetical protein